MQHNNAAPVPVEIARFRNMFQVRAATIKDCTAIGAIIRAESHHFLVDPDGAEAQRFYDALRPSAIEESMKHSARCYWVAEADSEVVGMIMIRDQNHISQFFVAGPHKGKGAGGKLWLLALNTALASGASGEFSVDSSLAAVPVYQSIGFAVAGVETVRNGFRFVPMHRPAFGG